MTCLASDPHQDASVEHSEFQFQVRLRTHRRTVLIQLFGDLDLATVLELGAAFESINLGVDGLRHVVLDLGGLTFMDASGVHELFRLRDYADENGHNLAVVRGRPSIRKLMAITGVDSSLVLVDSPDDLVPPLFGNGTDEASSAPIISDATRRALLTLVPPITGRSSIA
jgi:anti-anti-sigma factor